MTKTLTSRLGLPQWSSPNDPTGRTDFNAAFASLEAKAAIDEQGMFADRPAYGTRGRFYYATDRDVQYRDTGTAWVVVGATTDNVVSRGRTASTVVAALYGATGQTANLLSAMNVSGAVQAAINKDGDILAGGTYIRGTGVSNAVVRDAAAVSVSPLATSTPGIVVRGRASQTADLMRFQDNAGSLIAVVDAAGASTFKKVRILDLSDPVDDGDLIHKKYLGDNYVSLSGGNIPSPMGLTGNPVTIDVNTVGAPLRFRTSRAAEKDTTPFQIGAAGNVQIGGLTGSQPGTNLLTIYGAANQAGDYLRTIDSDGTTLSSIDKFGILLSRGLRAAQTVNSTVPLLNLENSSGSTVATIDYQGNFSANNFQSGTTSTRNQSSFIANMVQGALYWDTSVKQLFAYDGGWRPTAGRTFTVSSNEPSSPVSGDVWFEV